MSGCRNRYGYTTKDDCSRNQAASIFYFISTIAAMVVLGSITVLFFCCIYYKRRRITERLRNARNRGQQLTTDPVMYVWPGTADATPVPTSQATETDVAEANVSKEVAGAEPVSCVIMAGEEQPTFLAHPLAMDEFADVSLGSRLDELEQGKH